MPAHYRRIKQITFTLDGDAYECQLTSYEVQNNSDDGEVVRTLCPDGEFVEETDEEWSLNIVGLHDWRAAGISRFLLAANRTTVPFVLVHLDDVGAAENVQISGNARIKAPNIGGERGARDEFDVTFPLVGFDPATDITYPA